MKTGLLFDLDGTLLDTLADLHSGVNHALQAFGYPTRSLEEVRRFVGTGARNLIRLSLPQGTQKVDEVLAAFQRYYRAHCNVQTAPYAGVVQALRALDEFPIAIVSNKPDAAVKALCELHFPGIFALGEVAGTPRKPEPDMLRLAMAHIGAQRCIYIGDSEVDIQTAANAGVPCLSVTWGFRDEDALLRAGAQHICRSPADLDAALRAMII